MDDLTTRPYQDADAEALAALVNLIDEHAGGHPGAIADDMRSLVSALVRDVESDSRLVFAPDGTLVASAFTPTPPDGGFRVDLFGGVHPAWRGRGIGRELLAWQLDRAREIHRAVGDGQHWEGHTAAVLGDQEAVRLFQRFDLEPVRYWFEMVADTAQAPEVPVPDGLRVGPYTPAHEAAVHAAHMDAFLDHWGYQSRELDEWATISVRSASFLPELSLLAWDGDELAGYLLAYSDADPDRAYIGQVGTRRPWRRRGLAGALLARLLAGAGKAGLSKAYLGVDAASPTGAVGVYERVGFTVEFRSVTYAIDLP